MKRALIVGSEGQDGRLLRARLAATHHVVGVARGALELGDAEAVAARMREVAPDEVYYLAACHGPANRRRDDVETLRASAEVHTLGVAHVLDAVRVHVPQCRVFYAGSSHMFGAPATWPQDESTPFLPRTTYAITKVAGANVCAMFREQHGIFAVVGILYNHESRLRAEGYLSQRIVRAAREIARTGTGTLELAALQQIVDWGWAVDYVNAMVRMLAADTPDDYVLATGVPHTVSDFAAVAFDAVGLDASRFVVERPRAHTAEPAPVFVGNASKLRARTGWAPSISFEEMVTRLVHEAAAPPRE